MTQFRFLQGNIFGAATQALVNPVNCRGVSRAGLAKEFASRFTSNQRAYEQACYYGQVEIGKVFVKESIHSPWPSWVVNFPTKNDYKEPSDLRWITRGLIDLKRWMIEKEVTSVAIPALGCGLGHLNWPDVRKEILTELKGLPGVRVEIYLPIVSRRKPK